MLLRHTLFFLLIAGICFSCQSSSEGGNATSNQSNTRFDPGYQFPAGQLETNIREGVQYLARNVQPSGRFNYQQNLMPDVVIDPAKYNVLRHCGSVYAMGQAAEEYPDAVDIDAMVRAADYIRHQSLAPYPLGERPNLAVWSTPEVVNTDFGREVKLGGTGLGLLMFLAVDRQVPGYMSVDTLGLLAESILAMQRPDGSFESIYQAETGGFADHISQFYPGEAILALLELYSVDPNDRWLEAALDGFAFICTARQEVAMGDLPTDHWILLATTALIERVPAEKYAQHRSMIMDHGKRIAEKMVRTSKQNAMDTIYFGSFNASGSTTPLGTRLEGLLSFGVHLDPQEESALIDNLKQAVHYALGYVQGARVTEGPLRGGVTRLPKHLRRLKPEPANNRIQIDNVQHVMSGWIWAKRRQDWLWE